MMKRASSALFLGLAMAVAPVGGWLAVGGRGGWEPWLLAAAIGTWVGGFDVLYACQDLDFDRANGLRSIPVRFGVRRSLAISRAMHVLTMACFVALAWVTPLPMFYFAGVAAVGALLVYEQSLVRADDLSQVKRAFDTAFLLNPDKAIPTLHRCAEYGKMHVRRGQLPYPDLPRF